MSHAPLLFMLGAVGLVVGVTMAVVFFESHQRCAFCWRPSNGSSGVKVGAWGASVATCERHRDDGLALAWGRAHLAEDWAKRATVTRWQPPAPVARPEARP